MISPSELDHAIAMDIAVEQMNDRANLPISVAVVDDSICVILKTPNDEVEIWLSETDAQLLAYNLTGSIIELMEKEFEES